MRLRMSILALVLALGLVVAGCSGDDGDAATTTTGDAAQESSTGGGSDDAGGASGSDSASDATSAAADSTTTTVDLTVAIPEYSIVEREPGADGEGDVVIVELDPETYESLTDIDLQNVIADIVDEFPPVYEAHVVDSAEAVPLVLADDADIDAEAQRVLDIHYLVRLEEGFRIVFVGPFSDSGQAILGS